MLYWDTNKLEELFRAEVFRLLIEKDLIGRDTVNNMLSWKHSGFSADASVRVETIADAVRLGRYMIRKAPAYATPESWAQVPDDTSL